MSTAPRLALACLAALTVPLGAAGCTNLDEANASGVTRGDLVSELANQLAASGNLTYAATYQLAGGATATISQTRKPPRTAYTYPGGRTIVTADGTTRCRADTCDKRDPAPAEDHIVPGLHTPESVLALLNRAALDTSVAPSRHDTTFAGHHATCLSWPEPSAPPSASPAGAGATGLAVCVTNEGALGSFSAIVGGTRTEMALTAYTDKAPETDFKLPTSAKLTDHRTAG